MPININDSDALEKMTQIEGRSWGERQKSLEGGGDHFSFGYYRSRFALLLTNPDEFRPVTGVIYGEGGDHRYYIGKDGSIAFSSKHVMSWNKEHADNILKQAKDLGFDIV